MLSHSPCEAYLKYLVVHPDGYTNSYIRSIVRLQQLDYLGEPYVESLRITCVPPSPFFPEDPLHRPSQRFLRKERLYSIFYPDDDMKCALELLGKPRAKEIIETLLISKSSPAWICTALRRQAISATPGAIEKYKHYFFNTDLVDAAQLESLFTMRCEEDASPDVDVQRYAAAYRTASKNDMRRVAAQYSITPVVGMLNLIRMGILPSRNEINRMVTATMAVSLAQSLDTAYKGHAARGRDFAIMAKTMAEMTELMGDVDESLQEGLAHMILKTEEREVPHIKQLSEGNYTLDLQMEGKEDAEEARTGSDEDESE